MFMFIWIGLEELKQLSMAKSILKQVLFSISNVSFLSTFLKEFKEFIIKGKIREMQLKEICLIMHIQVLDVTNNCLCLVLGIFYFLSPFSLNFAICTKSVVIFICKSQILKDLFKF